MLLGRSLGCLERSWGGLGGLLGALGAVLEASWALLGVSWALLGRSWGGLGLLLGALGALLGRSWALLERSWAGLGRILVLLGASGPLWGRPGGAQGPPDTHFGTILRPSGDGLGTILGGIWEQLQSYLVMLFWDDLGTIWKRFSPNLLQVGGIGRQAFSIM